MLFSFVWITIFVTHDHRLGLHPKLTGAAADNIRQNRSVLPLLSAVHALFTQLLQIQRPFWFSTQSAAGDTKKLRLMLQDIGTLQYVISLM